MHIPIPIPIGAKNVAAIRGTTWKFVSCEHCQERFAYQLELVGRGEDHDLLFLDSEASAGRAQAKAEQNLLLKSKNVVLPVPCPNCGMYQDDMLEILRDEMSMNWLQFVGCVIVLLSFGLLVRDYPDNWVPAVILASIGSAVLTYGYVVASRVDLNGGDPEPRKALGRTYAKWGEQLTELIATNPSPRPDDALDGR